MSSHPQAKFGRILKRVAVLLGAGFLAFAPPGTLIFGAILILGLIGKAWLLAAGVCGLLAIVAVFLLVRRNSAARAPDEPSSGREVIHGEPDEKRDVADLPR
ncbi:MAG TPA: phage holin family protein [Pyrinomonadaceae bacterium]|jgi:hypothetical protein|nr:phage holin family protein [Pyrinomonadaceae bacterium]